MILDFKKGSDAAWVTLAIVDGVRRIYGWRDGTLSEQARATLEAKLADRNLTSEQSKQLREKLNHFSGQHLVAYVNPEDTEALAITSQLLEALRGAGWAAHLGGKGGIGVLGISLDLRGEISAFDAAAFITLFSVLNSIGLQTTSEMKGGIAPSRPELMKSSGLVIMTVGRRV